MTMRGEIRSERYLQLFISREAGEIIYLVPSVCQSICLFVISCLNRLTYDLLLFRQVGHLRSITLLITHVFFTCQPFFSLAEILDATFEEKN